MNWNGLDVAVGVSHLNGNARESKYYYLYMPPTAQKKADMVYQPLSPDWNHRLDDAIVYNGNIMVGAAPTGNKGVAVTENLDHTGYNSSYEFLVQPVNVKTAIDRYYIYAL